MAYADISFHSDAPVEIVVPKFVPGLRPYVSIHQNTKDTTLVVTLTEEQLSSLVTQWDAERLNRGMRTIANQINPGEVR